MNNLNPNGKYAVSNGSDLPIMTVYLAGRISGDNIDLCLAWRKQIINYYKDYKGRGQYPISFLCPLNSGEADSVDEKGLTSAIPKNLIYDKDLLSVKHADIIVANMDDFFEEGLKIDKLKKRLDTYLDIDKLNIEEWTREELVASYIEAISCIKRLGNGVLNRRENIGTVMEVAWAFLMNKPVILLVPESRKDIFEKHPFTCRASVIVSSVEELLEKKSLNILYKSISGAIYD